MPSVHREFCFVTQTPVDCCRRSLDWVSTHACKLVRLFMTVATQDLYLYHARFTPPLPTRRYPHLGDHVFVGWLLLAERPLPEMAPFSLRRREADLQGVHSVTVEPLSPAQGQSIPSSALQTAEAFDAALRRWICAKPRQGFSDVAASLLSEFGVRFLPALAALPPASDEPDGLLVPPEQCVSAALGPPHWGVLGELLQRQPAHEASRGAERPLTGLPPLPATTPSRVRLVLLAGTDGLTGGSRHWRGRDARAEPAGAAARGKASGRPWRRNACDQLGGAADGCACRRPSRDGAGGVCRRRRCRVFVGSGGDRSSRRPCAAGAEETAGTRDVFATSGNSPSPSSVVAPR